MDDSDSNKDDCCSEGVIKVKAIVEKEVENDTTIVNRKERKEKMKMTTLEADVKKDSTNGVKYNESVKKELVATLNNQSEKEVIDTAPVMTDVKEVIDASAPDVEVEIHGPSNPTKTWKQATVEAEVENGTTNQPEKITNGETTLKTKSNASAPPSAPDAKNDVEDEIHGPSNPTETWKQATVEAEVENGTTNQPEKITNGETNLKAKSHASAPPSASDEEIIANAPVITDVKQGINASAPDAENDVEVENHGPSNPTKTWKQATVEAEVENGTTIQPDKITNGKTTLKAKSNVSGESFCLSNSSFAQYSIELAFSFLISDGG